MNDNVQPLGYGYDTSTAQRNQVLRNTYWLLTLSLLLAVGGALLMVSAAFWSWRDAAAGNHEMHRARIAAGRAGN